MTPLPQPISTQIVGFRSPIIFFSFINVSINKYVDDGSGNPMLGAPKLSDGIWIYGGSRGAIRHAIEQGRQGQMPAHEAFLGEPKVHVLAAYVYSLSQTE